MGLLPEMEVRREDVLEEVDEEVAGEDEYRRLRTDLSDGLGHELDDRDAEEVPRAKRHEEPERAVRDPPRGGNDRATDEVPEGGGETEEEDERAHSQNST